VLVATALTLAPTTTTALRTDPLIDSCASDDANCCFSESRWPRNFSRFRCSMDENGTYPCSVKLGVNSWAGSFVNVYVAKIFIEEFLGYPVEIAADYSDMSNVYSENDVWPAMANATIDAVLEYWPSGQKSNVRKYSLEDGTVINAGSNGLTGKIGWFMNSFVLDEDPALEYWRTLKENLDMFVDPNVSEIPCCTSDPYSMPTSSLPCMPIEADGGTPVANGSFADYSQCDGATNISLLTAPFLAGAMDWAQHDSQIITNLGFNLTIEYAVTEDKIIEEVGKAEASGIPRVFYFWAPHGLFQKYDLTSVILPEYTTECEEKIENGTGDCGYATDILSKAYSTAMDNDMPDVSLFLDALMYEDNTQQEEMLLDQLDNSSMSWNEIACKWVTANNATTNTWTSAVEHKFTGQIWMSETLTPSYYSCDCETDSSRNVVAVYDNSNYMADGNVEIDPDEDPCSSERSYSVYRTRWTTLYYETTVVKTIQCAYIPNGSPEETVVYVLAILACVIMVLCFAAVIAYRNVTAVKSARIRTLSYLLFGAALMNISCIFDIGAPTSSKCALRFSFLLFGFFYFVGTLLIKQYTINSLMRAKYKLDKKGTKKATIFMRYEFAACLICGGICTLIWAFVVGFVPVQVVADSTLGVTEEVCPSNTTLLMLITAVCYMTIVASCMLASQTRNFSGLIFNEAKFMLFSNYNVAILTAFSLFVTLTEGMQPTLKSLFVALCVFFCTTSCALLVVGSRVYAAYYDMSAKRTSTQPGSANSYVQPGTSNYVPSNYGVTSSAPGSRLPPPTNPEYNRKTNTNGAVTIQ